MTCISNFGNNGINCKGNTPSSNIISVYNSFFGNNSYSTTFQINSILVPPTVQPIDTITVATYTSGLVGYDSCTVSFTNLNAVPLTSMSYTTSGKAYVNSAVPLTLSVPLLVNLYSFDYILIKMTSTYSPIYSLVSLTGYATSSQSIISLSFAKNSLTTSLLNITTSINITSGMTLYITISNALMSPSSGISPVFTVELYQ